MDKIESWSAAMCRCDGCRRLATPEGVHSHRYGRRADGELLLDELLLLDLVISIYFFILFYIICIELLALCL